jgi:protein-S-isoprenylcysteine O-methyltransferase Ste14
MGLGALAWFFSLGLWRQSLWFLVWLAVSVAPGWIFFVKVYEERELEMRFGPGYLEYKARTPMFWPRRPRPRGAL